jgi:hypothetical protein
MRAGVTMRTRPIEVSSLITSRCAPSVPRLAIASILAAALALTPWAVADAGNGPITLVPLDSAFQVNTFTPGYQGNPRIGMEGPGRFTVVWSSTRYGGSTQDGSGSGVFGRRYDAQGNALSTEFRVNSYTTSDQIADSAEQIRFHDQSTFAVTWKSNGQDGDGLGSFLQLFHDGARESANDLQVNTATTGNQFPSDVFLVPKSNVLRGGVCFEGPSLVGAQTEVYCRTGIYENGAPYLTAPGDGTTISSNQLQGTEFQVNTYTTGYQGRPSACGRGDGEFVVAWADFGRDPQLSFVYGRRGDVDGGAVGSEFEVTTNTSTYHDRPQICCSDDGFVVVWENGMFPGSVDGSGSSVSARLFDASATPRGTEFVVNQYTSGIQWRPSVACDPAGNFIVSWQAPNADHGGTFARAFAVDGHALTDETPIDSLAVPTVAGMSDHGTAVLAWTASTVTGDDHEVLAQRFMIPGLGGATTTTTAVGATTTTVPSEAICGDPVDPSAVRLGDTVATRIITASDALRTLQTAVGSASCALCVCDVNDSGTVTASDALIVLRRAVGQPVELTCPACG